MDVAALGGPFLVGLLLSWSLAAPPGPANAMIAHEAARRSWAAGVRTGMGAITADLAMFLLMGLGLLRIVGDRVLVQALLAMLGSGLMLFFAWGAWRAARKHEGAPDRVGSYAKALLVILTSPFNWGWWLTAGSTLFASLGWTVAIGFFAGLATWVLAWSGVARLGARRFERFTEWVAYASAAVLLLFAGLVAWVAAERIAALAG